MISISIFELHSHSHSFFQSSAQEMLSFFTTISTFLISFIFSLSTFSTKFSASCYLLSAQLLRPHFIWVPFIAGSVVYPFSFDSSWAPSKTPEPSSRTTSRFIVFPLRVCLFLFTPSSQTVWFSFQCPSVLKSIPFIVPFDFEFPI